MTAASPSLGRGGAAPSAPAARHLVERARRGLPLAAAVAVAVLALSSTGSMVVAAALLGAAVGDRRAAGATLLAVASVAVRFSTTSFEDLAGIQSVLGSAYEVGPATAAASAWAAATALVLVARPATSGRLLAGATALGAGAFAAAVLAGQGPGGDLWVRIVATAVAVALAGAIAATGNGRGRWPAIRPWVAVLAGVVAVVLAAWP